MSDVPSEEQERLAREFAEELRKLRVEDVLVNTLMHVSSIGYRRLGATADTREERDLDQVRLAIETMRALTPVLERFVPGELVRDFNSSVANLQLAYAKAASEARAAGGTAAEAARDAAEATGEGASEGSADRAEAGAADVDPPDADATEPSGPDVSGGQSPGRGENGQGGEQTQG